MASETSNGHRWWWLGSAVALVSALAGLGGAWVGADISREATLQAQQEAAQTQLEAEARKKRAGVYLRFLESANRYAYDVRQTRSCIRRAIGDGARRVPEVCVDELNDLGPSRYEYQGALNAVYIYGSSDAVTISALVSAQLPESVGGNPTTGLPRINDLLNAEAPLRMGDFRRVYEDFLSLTCREASPVPRDDCRTPTLSSIG